MEGIFEILYIFLDYYRYTGDERVLKAVTKAADLTLEKTRGRELWGNAGWPAPLGMIELYRTTRNKRYLDRAQAMVEACWRGDPTTELAVPFAVRKDRIQGHTAATGELLLELAGIYEVTGDAAVLARARTLSESVER